MIIVVPVCESTTEGISKVGEIEKTLLTVELGFWHLAGLRQDEQESGLFWLGRRNHSSDAGKRKGEKLIFLRLEDH